MPLLPPAGTQRRGLLNRPGVSIDHGPDGCQAGAGEWWWSITAVAPPRLVALVDLHTHILPGVDDGPADMAGTVALASAFVAAGVERVVATPHVNHRWGPRIPQIGEALEETRAVLDAEGVPLKVEVGAELALSTAVVLDTDSLAACRLGQGEWLLVEPPARGSSTGVHSMIFTVLTRGHRVLLAHPERCEIFQRDLDLLDSLVAGGVRTQVTAAALSGGFGGTARRTTEEMFDRGLAHVVASDAHHATHRPPGLAGDMRNSPYSESVRYFCHDMPNWILDGGPEPERPRARRGQVTRRGILGRLGFRQ